MPTTLAPKVVTAIAIDRVKECIGTVAASGPFCRRPSDREVRWHESAPPLAPLFEKRGKRERVQCSSLADCRSIRALDVLCGGASGHAIRVCGCGAQLHRLVQMAAKNIRLAGKSRLGDDDGFKSFTIHTAASPRRTVEERDAPAVPDPLTAARRRRSSRRHVSPNVRCSPNCGLWPQDQAERRAIGAGEVGEGPEPLGRAFASPPARPETGVLGRPLRRQSAL